MWTTDRYRQFLRSNGLTQADYAALLGHSARAGQYWATQALAPAAETMARLIEARPELLDVLRQLATDRDAEAMRNGNRKGVGA